MQLLRSVEWTLCSDFFSGQHRKCTVSYGMSAPHSEHSTETSVPPLTELLQPHAMKNLQRMSLTIKCPPYKLKVKCPPYKLKALTLSRANKLGCSTTLKQLFYFQFLNAQYKCGTYTQFCKHSWPPVCQYANFQLYSCLSSCSSPFGLPSDEWPSVSSLWCYAIWWHEIILEITFDN